MNMRLKGINLFLQCSYCHLKLAKLHIYSYWSRINLYCNARNKQAKRATQKNEVINMLEFLVDNIFVEFKETHFQQINGMVYSPNAYSNKTTPN